MIRLSGVGAFALSAVFFASCNQPNPGEPQHLGHLSREVESSDLSFELRELHSRQQFGQLVVTGTEIGDLYDSWFHAVYKLAPTVDGNMKMIPHGVVRGTIAAKSESVGIDLTGKSPLESLDSICTAFDAYFKYDADTYSVVVAATKEQLEPKADDNDPHVGSDPFSTSDETDKEPQQSR
ncbi:MAG: hypothetical protein H7A49_10980 [Akkermansiaceae bacterium]|nr:hypothetical protein [Akkermansiaceae bacterium]